MKKIVLVDDNKMYLEMVKEFIEFRTDFESITFLNPKEALRYILEEKDIYAVVTDYEMPKMNGFKLAKQVYENLPDTKIIVMSGHDTRYLEEISKKAGLENKIRLLCKSNIINLIVVLKS